jgi:hypothetical protein
VKVWCEKGVAPKNHWEYNNNFLIKVLVTRPDLQFGGAEAIKLWRPLPVTSNLNDDN